MLFDPELYTSNIQYGLYYKEQGWAKTGRPNFYVA